MDEDGDGVSSPQERIVLVEKKDGKKSINHGLLVHGGFLYASGPGNVWRWPFKASAI